MKNPYANALLAFLYVLSVAFFMHSVPPGFDHTPVPLGIATMLGLLVLSVAVMGFLFFFTPAQLALEQKFKEGTVFFGKTAATFAALLGILVITITLLI